MLGIIQLPWRRAALHHAATHTLAPEAINYPQEFRYILVWQAARGIANLRDSCRRHQGAQRRWRRYLTAVDKLLYTLDTPRSQDDKGTVLRPVLRMSASGFEQREGEAAHVSYGRFFV